MSDILSIGIDLGYGQVKLAALGYRASFPSVVATPGAHTEPDGMVQIHGTRYIVGVPALADPTHRYATRLDKSASDEDEMARYCAALARAANHYDTNIMSVHLGLAPAAFRDEELRRKTQARFTGIFTFTFEGRPYQITVPAVTVDPQAGAAYFDLLLHDDGTINRHELLERNTVVMDIGHRTTDLALMTGRKAAFGRDSLRTIDRGVWDTYEEMQRLLLQSYRLPITAAQVDPIWRNGGLRLSGQWTGIDHLKPQAVAPVAEMLMREVERVTRGLQTWDAVLLVGGGAHLLGPYLQLETRIIQPADPEYSNAAGYFKRRMEQQKARV